MIVESIKTISMYLVSGLALKVGVDALQSDYLFKFIDENLITILIALLAINTTTSSVIMTKLKEISDANMTDFSQTLSHLKASIVEQVLLVIVGLILLSAKHSQLVANASEWMRYAIDCGLLGVFLAGLYRLYDTANSIFVILNYENGKEGG